MPEKNALYLFYVAKAGSGRVSIDSLVYVIAAMWRYMFVRAYITKFQPNMAGNTLQEIAFILPMMIASCGLGYVYQAFVSEREEVFISWVFTSIIFLFLSGLIWPRYAMPPVWKALSAICPATWGVEGFIKMNANGSTLAQVRTEYINLWILAGAWWIVGWAVRKWVVRPQIFGRKK